MIQVVEDMLRACMLDFKGNWSNHLSLVEFAYNNSYQASIGMAPYEALYGRPCRSPHVGWKRARVAVWARDCSGNYKEDSTHPGKTTHGAK